MKCIIFFRWYSKSKIIGTHENKQKLFFKKSTILETIKGTSCFSADENQSLWFTKSFDFHIWEIHVCVLKSSVHLWTWTLISTMFFVKVESFRLQMIVGMLFFAEPTKCWTFIKHESVNSTQSYSRYHHKLIPECRSHLGHIKKK